MGEICDFGQYGKYIISPSYVHSLLSKPSTPVTDEISTDETELTDLPVTVQSSENNNVSSNASNASNASLTPSTSYSHRTTDDVKDSPVFPSLQRSVSERITNQQDRPPQLLWSRPSEQDDLRYRECADLFDLDELSPSTSPPPNLVEYTHRYSRSVRGEEDGEGEEDREMEKIQLERKCSRKFSWHALLEDTTNSFMGYMKNIPN